MVNWCFNGLGRGRGVGFIGMECFGWFIRLRGFDSFNIIYIFGVLVNLRYLSGLQDGLWCYSEQTAQW